MRIKVATTFLWTAAFGLFATGANAAECRPQKIITSVNLILHPGGVPLVPVSLAGMPKLLVVDTGGFVGMLFPDAVRQLGLRTGVSAVGTVTVNGAVNTSTAVIPDFVLGGLRAPSYKFIVQSGPGAGPIPEDQPIGLLAPDILQNYDADFDFGTAKFNLIDPEHCAGKVVYWQASGVAVIPFRLDKSYHVIFPVSVDGKKMSAMLDTGASNTLMNLNIARSLFHLDTTAPDVEKIGELKGVAYTADIYRRRFSTLTFGDVVVRDPVMDIVPDMTKARFPITPRTGSLLPDPDQPRGLQDIVIGMTTLSKLHVYIAYGERKLYITEAETQQ